MKSGCIITKYFVAKSISSSGSVFYCIQFQFNQRFDSGFFAMKVSLNELLPKYYCTNYQNYSSLHFTFLQTLMNDVNQNSEQGK